MTVRSCFQPPGIVLSNRTCHIPVLLPEILQWLQPTAGMIVIDGTLGGGGHTLAMAEKVVPDGQVIGIDLDHAAIDRVQQRLGQLPVRLAQASFTEIPEVLESAGIQVVEGILLDLGLSSDQLADEQRGFSFQADSELDLRFDTSQGEPAWQLLSRIDERRLADIIYQYGEERFSRRIARRIRHIVET